MYRTSVVAACLLVVPVAAAEKPNVVLILADDLGIYDLGCYGRREHATPHLDRLAAQGTRFTSAYCAQPICSPSRAAILTGKAPARLHLTTFLPGRADAASQKLLHPKISPQLPPTERTLAEDLKAAGYATACVGKWHLGGAGAGPAAQGFDVVHPGRGNTPPTAEEGGKGEFDLTAAAVKFVATNRDRPFFLYLPHHSPHIPLAAQADRVARFKDAYHPTYAACVNALDEAVGKVLAALDEHKLADRTLVVFASDNGGLHVPELADGPPTHNGPFRAGKGFLYEGGLRVPTIVRWPGRVPAGAVSDTPFVNADWRPTILAACGLPVPAGLDGDNVLSLLEGKPPPARSFHWHFPHYTNQGSRPGGAVRAGNGKLIEHYEDGRAELYDLAADPGEATDLAAAKPAMVADLRAKLAAWRKAVGAQENVLNPAFDAAAHRKLYHDVDVSKWQPGKSSAETWGPLKAWRAGMDAAVKKSK